ncbi:hypothetical protein ACTC6W_001086 [Escherichia coli]
MSNINKQALRGQSVEGSYYLAECGHCGEMYPSNKLDGGESLFSGDYGECFCHLCGADDSDIADNGAWGSEAVTAWNYQQKRIEALLDENYRLTAERDALRENIGGDNTRAAADIYFQLVEECEIPAGGSLVEYVDDMREKLEAAEKRIAELEANKCKPVMFIDGDISPADADKLAAVIREFNEETETPAARMARIIRENPHPTNMCDMPAAGIGKGE